MSAAEEVDWEPAKRLPLAQRRQSRVANGRRVVALHTRQCSLATEPHRIVSVSVGAISQGGDLRKAALKQGRRPKETTTGRRLVTIHAPQNSPTRDRTGSYQFDLTVRRIRCRLKQS